VLDHAVLSIDFFGLVTREGGTQPVQEAVVPHVLIQQALTRPLGNSSNIATVPVSVPALNVPLHDVTTAHAVIEADTLNRFCGHR
jgi:hypothetical protein